MHWPLSTRDSTRAIQVATSRDTIDARVGRRRHARRAPRADARDRERNENSPRASAPPSRAMRRRRRRPPGRRHDRISRCGRRRATSSSSAIRWTSSPGADATARATPRRRTRCDAHTHTNTYLDLGRLEGGDAGDEGGREKGRHFQGNARCANMTFSTRASRARSRISRATRDRRSSGVLCVCRLVVIRRSRGLGLDGWMRVYIRGVTRVRGGF